MMRSLGRMCMNTWQMNTLLTMAGSPLCHLPVLPRAPSCEFAETGSEHLAPLQLRIY